MEYVLPILKFGGIFIAALLGVLGLLVDFKNDGKITKWGKKALIGIVVSFLFSATIQGIEIYQAKQKVLAKEVETQKMLSEIQRTLHPINPDLIYADFSMTTPIALLKNTKLVNDINGLIAKSSKADSIENLLKVDVHTTNEFYGENQEFERFVNAGFGIHPESNIFPSVESDPLSYRAFVHQGLDLSIYRNDGNISFDSIMQYRPDLSFRIAKGQSYISYAFHEYLRDSLVELHVRNTSVNRKEFSWDNNGRIESLMDLAGAYVVVSLMDDDYLTDDRYLEILKKSEINALTLYMGNRMFHISRLQRTKDRFYPEYYFQFPEKMSQEKSEKHTKVLFATEE